jgi:hypothetical protein
VFPAVVIPGQRGLPLRIIAELNAWRARQAEIQLNRVSDLITSSFVKMPDQFSISSKTLASSSADSAATRRTRFGC